MVPWQRRVVFASDYELGMEWMECARSCCELRGSSHATRNSKMSDGERLPSAWSCPWECPQSPHEQAFTFLGRPRASARWTHWRGTHWRGTINYKDEQTTDAVERQAQCIKSCPLGTVRIERIPCAMTPFLVCS